MKQIKCIDDLLEAKYLLYNMVHNIMYRPVATSEIIKRDLAIIKAIIDEAELVFNPQPEQSTEPHEWVSVKDRLPELNEPLMGYNDNNEQEVFIENFEATVLAYSPGMGVYKARLSKRGWCEISSVSSKCVSPTHWMPLPAPPNPEQSNSRMNNQLARKHADDVNNVK